MKALTEDFDQTGPREAAAAGQGVLFANAHSGVSTAQSDALSRMDLGIPQLTVGNHAKTGGDADGNLRLGTHDLDPRSFLRWSRSSKRSPIG